jgi:hypothetical protein
VAKVFLAVPQYKKLHPTEIQRIKHELEMEDYECILDGFHPKFDHAVSGLIANERHEIRFSSITGDGNLPRARAIHLGMWREEYDTPDRCDYFMIVDDDISFNPEAIDILIGDDKPIVGGIYTFKTTDPGYVGKACTRFFKRQVLSPNGPFEVQWLNGGFIMVKAETLLKMIDAYPELVIDVPKESSGKITAKETWALWTPRVYHDNGDRLFLGEDWSFCQRAREIGFNIYADLRVKLVHWSAEDGYAIHI